MGDGALTKLFETRGLSGAREAERWTDAPCCPRASLGALIAGVLSLALGVSGCEAQTPESVAAAALTGREIHELQKSSEMEVSRVVEAGGARYFVPRASYVRLGEVGRGTPSAYYQAWIRLRGADGQRDVDEPLAATVTFMDPGRPRLASPDDSWIRSDMEIPGLGTTTLWLDTRECRDDDMPPPAENAPDLRIRVGWTIADTKLELNCRASLAPTPNGKRPMACFGGSEVTPSGVTFGLYGGASLDHGCRSALESLVSSFAHLPLIAADWREPMKPAN